MQAGKVSAACARQWELRSGTDTRQLGLDGDTLTRARSASIISILAGFRADLTCELRGAWHELPRRAEGQGRGGQGHPLLWVTNSCWLCWEVLSEVGSQLKQPMSSEVKQ